MRAALISLLLCAAPAAHARPALRPLPPETVLRYAETLRHGEIALVESDESGKARQITVLGYVAAPPERVYALVADPTIYPRYVRNLVRSDVERRGDGSLLNRWRVTYPIGSFEGEDELRLQPAAGGAPGVVDVRTLGEGKEGTSRWEFLPAPGGGTVVVDYGYYDSLDNWLLRAMIGKNPVLDAGFNLAGGLSVMRSLLAYAAKEARAAGLSIQPPPAGRVDFEPLLSRGTVAVVRTDDQSHLVDVSVVERIPVPPERLLELVRTPETWPQFLRSITRVKVSRRDGTGVDYQMTVAGVIFDVVTDYRTSFVEGGADTLGLSGALKGARFRWDLRPAAGGGTVAVWRGNVHIGDSSRMVRAMFAVEPSFEHSANISVGLISVRSMAAQAIAQARGAGAGPRP